MNTLIIAEHDNHQLKSSTLNTISAAQKLKQPITVLVAGFNCQVVATEIHGVEKILIADANCFEHALAENVAELIVYLAKDYSHILSPATTFGKNIMPRVAAKLNVSQISDIIEVVSPDTFKRPIYAGNAIATVKSSDETKVITVRTTAFPATKNEGVAKIQNIDFVAEAKNTMFVSQSLSQSERPELTEARIVVAGGRALKDKEKFKLIEDLADKLGAAVGASRAAVDAGIVPNDYQVGQTGKIVAPELYIAIGISGAIQHVAGMKDSKIVVAINNDKDAPIFDVADYGFVGDLFEVIPKMLGEKLC